MASAIRNSSEVAKATAEKRGALEADIQTLPRFLDELKPTMERLGSLSDETTPVLADLHARAGDINNVVRRLGPFSTAAIPAVDSLGEAAKTGTPAVIDARPVIADLRGLAKAVRPVGVTLREVLESFQETGGIERLMDYIFYQAAAVNGFDAVGHYLRAGLIVNQCATYAQTQVAGCSAKFPDDHRLLLGRHREDRQRDRRDRRRPGAAGDGDRARAGARAGGREGQEGERGREEDDRQAAAGVDAQDQARPRRKQDEPLESVPTVAPEPADARPDARARPTRPPAAPPVETPCPRRPPPRRPRPPRPPRAPIPRTRCSTTCSARTAADERRAAEGSRATPC